METEQDIKMETQPAPAAQPADAESSDLQRREFLKRCGAYSAGAAVGLCILMKPGVTMAISETNEDCQVTGTCMD